MTLSVARRQVYHDGELVEDLDDDFPNGIQLPTAGAMRLGRGQGDSDPGFRGRYSCLQFFDAVLTRDDVRNLPANCHPDSWSLQPEGEGWRRPELSPAHFNSDNKY